MRIFDLFCFKYNRTDFHELNLDWIISDLRTLAETLENFISLNTIKYANPIQWNITTQYEANTVVINANDGTAYLSVKPVPSGVALTNTDYWTPIFTLNLLSANQNITLRDDGSNILATFASNTDDWLIWNATLYKVSQPIAVNEAYVVGYNIERYTVEMFIDDYIGSVKSLIGELDNLTTIDKTNLVAAINELVSTSETISNNIGDITQLDTVDKTNVVNAINELHDTEVFANVKEFGAVGDGITDDRAAFVTAIASNKPVFVPEGTYRISEQITVGAGIHIVGAGPGRSIIKFDVQNTNQKYVFYNTDNNNSKKGAIFKNFTINVNNYSTTIDFIGGILLTRFNDVLVDNVEVLNTSNSGNGVVLWNCSNSTISNCYCHELYGDGIYVCNKSKDVQIIANKVVNCNVKSGAIDIYDSERITATNNYVCPNETSQTFGFNLDTVRQCIISNNHCINGRCGIATFVINESVITGNTCRNNDYAGIQVEISIDGVTNSNNNIFADNFIEYNDFGIVDTANSYWNKYQGNIITNSNKHGIYVIGGSYQDIDGNTITNSGTDAANTYADIAINSLSAVNTYTKITNNTCNSGSAFTNISTGANVNGLLIVGNNCIAKGAGTYNIRNTDIAARIIEANRGTYNT